MPRRTTKLKLEEETFGEKLHRAYRTCRKLYGLKYLDHAEAISEWINVSDQALMRWEIDFEDLPTRPRQRQLTYLAIIAYGFDPADFGLTPENSGLAAWDITKVEKALNPANRRPADRSSKSTKKGTEVPSPRCTSRHDQRMPQPGPTISAGQRGRRAA